MSDDIDRAQDEVERSLGEALRQRKAEGPTATGRCLYCDEILDDTRRWCDAEHREQWEKEARRGR
jgi:hypothetical protein